MQIFQPEQNTLPVDNSLEWKIDSPLSDAALAITICQKYIQQHLEEDTGTFVGLGCKEDHHVYDRSNKIQFYNEQYYPRCSVYDLLSFCYLILERYEEGKVWYKTMLEMQPDKYQLLYGYANILYNSQLYTQALDFYIRVTKIKPDFDKGFQLAAFTYMKLQDKAIVRSKAAILASRSLQINPQNMYSQLLMAILQNDSQVKEDMLKNLAVKYPRFWRIKQEIILNYYQAKNYKNALEFYSELISLRAQVSPQLLLIIGKCYNFEHDFERAVLFYKQYLKQSKIDEHQVYLLIAKCFLEQNFLMKAISYFWKVVIINQENAEAYLGLAECYKKKGRIQQYFKNVKNFLQLTGQSHPLHTQIKKQFSDYYHSQALKAIDRQKYDLAICYLTKEEQIDPENIQTKMLIGQLYETMHKLQKAIAKYVQVLNLQPNSQLCYKIAQIYQRIGNSTKKKAYFIKCLDLNPQYYEVMKELAANYYAERSYELALQYYIMLENQNQTSPTLYINMALIFNCLNRAKETLVYFQRAKEGLTPAFQYSNPNDYNFVERNIKNFEQQIHPKSKFGYRSAKCRYVRIITRQSFEVIFNQSMESFNIDNPERDQTGHQISK